MRLDSRDNKVEFNGFNGLEYWRAMHGHKKKGLSGAHAAINMLIGNTWIEKVQVNTFGAVGSVSSSTLTMKREEMINKKVTSSKLYTENLFLYYLSCLKRIIDNKDSIRSSLKLSSKLSQLPGGPVDLFDELITRIHAHLPHLADLTLD